MTTINDISDLVRILRDDPAWAEAVRSVLLTQELLRLPEEVAALTKAFREYAEATDRRLASLEAGQERLEATVNEMRGELGNLSGSFYQRRAATFAQRIAKRTFGFTTTSLIHHADHLGENQLSRMLDEAALDESKDFTEDDTESLEQADMVIMGTGPDGTEAYLLAEASVTVNEDDVKRAAGRAELLRLATGQVVHGVVIGQTITEQAAAQAEIEGVMFAGFTPGRTPPPAS